MTEPTPPVPPDVTRAAPTPPPEPTAAIEIRGLTYWYRRHRAVDDLSFRVEEGSIHGFVGPNGAGKTTTLRVIATLLRPRIGRVKVFGYDIRTQYKDVRREMGFMPDHFSMYRQMTVFEYLDFFGAAYGLDLKRRTSVIDDVLALTDMGSRKDELIKNLSRGMQQRISLSRVLVHDPRLLLLDEPASGLDPRARIELMEILQELRRMGKTIFISSHILSELAELCDSVTIVDRGKVRFSGPMQDLTENHAEQSLYHVELEAGTELPRETVAAITGVMEVLPLAEDHGYSVVIDEDQTTPTQMLNAVIAAGGQIRAFRRDRRHLNEAFMELTEAGVA